MSAKTEYHEIMELIRRTDDAAVLSRIVNYSLKMQIEAEKRLDAVSADMIATIPEKFRKAYIRVSAVSKLPRCKTGLSVAVMRNQIIEVREMDEKDLTEFRDLLSRRGWRYRPSLNDTGKRTWVYFPPKNERPTKDNFEY